MDKLKMKVPCIFKYWSASRNQFFESVPAVDCGVDCEHCGWNPAETKRRFETGLIHKHNGISTLYFKRKDTNHE